MENVKTNSESLKISPLVSPEAGHGWKLEFFEVTEPVPEHCHTIQRQMIVVVQGELMLFCDGEKSGTVRSGELMRIDSGIVHSMIPHGLTRFFCIDILGFLSSDDLLYDAPVATSHWISSQGESLPELDPEQFNHKIDLGTYTAYDLVTGSETENRWSVALLQINDSPKHFHKWGKEIFVVVNGTLSIEVDGTNQILTMGEYIVISPNSVHYLRSATNNPVRVLCFNFPAFDPADMYCIG